MSGYVYTVRFSVSSFNRVCVNIYTPRFIKALLFLSKAFSWARGLYEDRRSVKLFSLSPIYCGRGYVLDEGICLDPGSRCFFNLSIASSDPSFIDKISRDHEDVVEIPDWSSKFRVTMDSVEMSSINELSIGFSNSSKQVIRLVLNTPMLLSSKLMAPPLDGFRRRVERMPNLYILYPSTGHICSYLAKLWYSVTGKSICGGPSSEWAAYFMGRLCEVALVPIDLRIDLRTIKYDENRRIRGFIGWAILRLGIRDRRVIDRIDKLFALASKLGIGKSRTIGFGLVRAEVRELRD